MPSGWDVEGMQLCKQRSYGRAVRGNGVFLKEYIYTSWFRRLRRTLSEPRPFIALAAARRMHELGVPTPEVLAAVRAGAVSQPSTWWPRAARRVARPAMPIPPAPMAWTLDGRDRHSMRRGSGIVVSG